MFIMDTTTRRRLGRPPRMPSTAIPDRERASLWEPRDVAALLSVTPTLVRRWCDDGRLPCLRTTTGLRVMFPQMVRPFIDEYVARRRAEEAKRA